MIVVPSGQVVGAPISVQLERVLVILGEGRVLLFLEGQTVADGQDFDAGAHEAVELSLIHI